METSDQAMTVLATGGAGYVGSTVVMALLGIGKKVISVDNLYLGSYAHLSQYKDERNLEMMVGDISSASALRNAVSARA